MSRLLSSIALLAGVLAAGVSSGHVGSVYQSVTRPALAPTTQDAAVVAQAPARKPRIDKLASAYPMFVREVDGRPVYSLRELPGAERVYAYATKRSAPAAEVTAQVLAKLGPPRIDVHAPLFVKAALSNVVDEAFLRAIAHVESNYKPNARSRVGAKGIMQLMPATARQFRVRNPYSAEQSIDGGARYIGKLLRRYDGDVRLAAAAYNAGPGNVRRYDGVPPFDETREYVRKVEVMYAQYRVALASRPARG